MTQNTSCWQELKEELKSTFRILGYSTLGAALIIGAGYVYIRLFI